MISRMSRKSPLAKQFGEKIFWLIKHFRWLFLMSMCNINLIPIVDISLMLTVDVTKNCHFWPIVYGQFSINCWHHCDVNSTFCYPLRTQVETWVHYVYSLNNLFLPLALRFSRSENLNTHRIVIYCICKHSPTFMFNITLSVRIICRQLRVGYTNIHWMETYLVYFTTTEDNYSPVWVHSPWLG